MSQDPQTPRPAGSVETPSNAKEAAAETPAKPTGWRAVASNLAGTDKPDTLAATAGTLLRAPIQGAVDLALRDDFNSHLKLFGIVVAGVYGLMFVTVPNWSTEQLGGQATASPKATVLYMAVQYALLVLALPVFHQAFQHLTGEMRTPMSYFKLTLIAASVGSLIYCVSFYVFAAGWALWTLDAPDPTSQALRVALARLLFCAGVASTAYIAAVHARFWNTRWIWVFLGLMAASVPIGYVSGLLFGILGAPFSLPGIGG